MPMNCLLYFEDFEAEAALQYGTRLRNEGHRCQFRNGRIFKYAPVPEVGEPVFDCIIISDKCEYCAEPYRRWFANENCKYKGAVEVISLALTDAPATPVDEVVRKQATTPPPLPTAPVDYQAMPWHVLKKTVEESTGTQPKNKKEALGLLQTCGLI